MGLESEYDWCIASRLWNPAAGMQSLAAGLWKPNRARHSQKRGPPASRAGLAAPPWTPLSQVHISSLNSCRSRSNKLRTQRLPAVTTQLLHSTY